VRDIGGYARLLDLVAASSGRVVNLHALILFRIPAWSGSDRASLVWCTTGVRLTSSSRVRTSTSSSAHRPPSAERHGRVALGG
jgi:hypothetical protein